MSKRRQRPRELEQYPRRLKKLRPVRDQRRIDVGIRAVLHLTGVVGAFFLLLLLRDCLTHSLTGASLWHALIAVAALTAAHSGFKWRVERR